jgi:hypothetical protein
MFQVIVYDCSGNTPLIVDRSNFNNEECAWSWYDYCSNNSLNIKGRNITKKRVEVKVFND